MNVLFSLGRRRGDRMGRCAWLSVVLVFTTVSARADEWPQFRGPNRDASWNEAGLLRAFPPEGPNVRWRVPVGPGWSSPVVAAGRVFLTDVKLEKPAAFERIWCFDETTGSVLWSYHYPVTYPEWAFTTSNGSAPAATPVVENGIVYTIGAGGHVHSLNAADGGLRWERDLARDFDIKLLSCRPSPLIDQDRLILCTGAKPGAYVLALDKTNGKEIWRALDETISNSSPMIIEVSGTRQLIVWTGDSAASLNPDTGATYWRIPMQTSNNDAIPTPVFEGSRLLIGGLMLELGADPIVVTVLWPGIDPAGKRILSNTSTALLRGGFVYSALSNGELVCLDAASGEERWRTESVTGRKGGASIHIAPSTEMDLLYTDEGSLILTRLNPDAFEEISRTSLLKPTTPFGGNLCVWPPPAFANRHIYARNDVEIVCASLATLP